MKRLLLAQVCLVIVVFSSGAQEDDLLVRARDVFQNQSSQQALRLLKQGMTESPENPEYPRELAKIYMDQGFYGPATEMYSRVLDLDPESSDSLRGRALAFRAQGLHDEAMEDWKSLVDQSPGNQGLVSEWGWESLKAGRAAEALLVIKELDFPGDVDPSLSLTLGSLYYESGEIGSAREAYRRALEAADEKENRVLGAVICSNLALLEHRVGRYAVADRWIRESLSRQQRASGFRELGRLDLERGDLQEARIHLSSASDLDETPQSAVLLASLLLSQGLFDEALGPLRVAEANGGGAWLSDFNLTGNQFQMEIHGLFERYYMGLFRREGFLMPESSWEGILSLGKRIKYRFLAWYHGQKFGSYALALGNDYWDRGRVADACDFYKTANRNYPESAVRFLQIGRESRGSGSYVKKIREDLEQAIILGETEEISRLSRLADRTWARGAYYDSLEFLFREDSGKLSVAEELFAWNPGVFGVNGWEIPVVMNHEYPGPWNEAGIRVLNRDTDYRWALELLQSRPGWWSVQLKDRVDGSVLRSVELRAAEWSSVAGGRNLEALRSFLLEPHG